MTEIRSSEIVSACAAQEPAEPYRLGTEEVLAGLRVEADSGLSPSEVRSRLERCGRNELRAAEPVPTWQKILTQFTDVLVVLLLVAAAASAGLWLYEREASLPYEAIAILAIVLLNAAMSFVQEARADRAVAALRQMSAAQARVVRGGKHQTVPATDLVPGDIIRLEEGDTIPADGRLIQTSLLQTTEAILTGESLPVFKDVTPVTAAADLGSRSNMVFCGTTVTCGRGLAVVTATGARTEIGHIAGILRDTPEESTPLQAELDRVGKRLGLVVAGIAVVLITTIVVVEDVRGVHALLGVLILGVALAVAAVPEGLPAIVTAALSLGVQRMAKRKAIVRHLAAVETLGSADVIASDKTGTLTRNEMTVRVVVTASGRVDVGGSGYVPIGQFSQAGGQLGEAHRSEVQQALLAGLLANNAVLQERNGHWTVQGDPTEGALIAAARKTGLEAGAVARRFVRIAEIPFSSERRLMSTIQSDAERDAELFVATKGAPDVVLARCSQEFVEGQCRALTRERRSAIAAANEALAGEGLRSLGVAFRSLRRNGVTGATLDGCVEQDLVFLGLTGMTDPPRPETGEAVARAGAAGIRLIMITGDHPGTASAIAAELGFAAGARTVTGAQLVSSSMVARGISTQVQPQGVPMAWSISPKIATCRSQKSPGTRKAMIWRLPFDRSL
ncbi:cation-translocating P-type ATPase [Methylobacterium nigriterrae]|uniref:cation-translocating P-type ATPase n=1 Tax=Methylobacterium nigriterrae TaxID=3127512 RepID=UPI0030135783